MTPLWVVMIAVAQVLGWLSSPPRSLAAAAEREAIRRQLAGPSVGFYGNDTLDAPRAGIVEASGAEVQAGGAAGPVANVRGESWWRERVAAIRAAITRAEKEIGSFTNEIARLDSEAISRDDPAQQALLRNQANNARDELEKRRADVLSARRELAELLEEARRLDVPPGWLR